MDNSVNLNEQEPILKPEYPSQIIRLSKLPLIFFSLLVLLTGFGQLSFTTKAQGGSSELDVFIIYAGNGGTTCREATTEERRQIEQIKPQGLRQINHLTNFGRQKEMSGQAPAPRLTIILRATPALDANPAAKAAFIRGAAVWENAITSPVTIYIDADYDTTNNGQAWGDFVIGSTSSFSRNGESYSNIRNRLLAGANTPQKSLVYNSLPTTSFPSDVGNSTVMSVSHSIARAIGLMPATALSTEPAARIAFNSNINFDFDRSNGIQGSDFEAVVIHEIGHALGFTSRAGGGTAAPAMWDLYRFRAGTTNATFQTAQRVMTIGGPPDNTLQFFFYPGGSDIGLSTGGPNGVTSEGGDDQQSSHWKRQNQNGNVYIGIMDPVIPNNTRRDITVNDTNALEIFGYNSSTIAAPPNDNFNLGRVIGGCTGTVTDTNAGATKETGEPNHFDDTPPNPGGGSRSVWYIWQAPSTGTVTFHTVGSDFDTVLSVYTGTTVGSLTKLGQSDDANPDRTSLVSFSATAGTIYRIAVDGYNNSGSGGDVGSIQLNWTAGNCPAGNPIDDAGFFVRQHYLDFLNREPDTAGFNFWRNEITSCGSDAQCIAVKRINVSAAFFLSIEYQQTGYYVERMYKTAYGSDIGNSTFGGAHTLLVPKVRFNEFQTDKQQIGEGIVVGQAGWEAALDTRKNIYASDFVARSRFTTAFPSNMSNLSFVNALNSNAGNPLSTAERDQLVADLDNASKTRAQVLRAVAEDPELVNAEVNRAFVLVQFFGYLRRNPNDTPDPDYTGFDFWFGKLNQFNGNFVNAEMVKAFLLSGEYRQRFGP